GMTEEAKGVVREGWGKVTDRPSVELKGQLEQAMGQVKQFVGGVKESLGSALDKVRQDPSMTQAGTRRAALKLLAYIAGALIVVNEIMRAPRRRKNGSW
ncbi:MAG: CsbD family protein, partial [bacterium]